MNNDRFYNYQDNVSERFSDSFNRSQDEEKRSWNEKAARNGETERHVILKKVLNITLWCGCFSSTLSEQSWSTQVCCYLPTLSYFIGADPFEMFNRILAPQTRNVLAFMLLVILPAVIYPQKSLLIVVSIIIAIGLTIIKLMNKSWLASYNWLMSAEAQKALRIDQDNIAARSWQAHGRRETRTLLYELGHDADDETLDIFHRPVYLCGFLNGYQKHLNCEQQIQKLQNEVNRLSAYEEKCEHFLKENQEYEIELGETKQQLEEESSKSNYWKKQWEKERALNEQIMTANNELLSGLSEPTIIVENQECIEQIKELTLEERVLSALDSGMSYAEAGKFAGCSKTTAWKIGKKRKEADESCGLKN